MTTHTTHDPFNAIREAGTNGANYVLDTPDIIDRLIQWQSLCSFDRNSYAIFKYLSWEP